MWHIYKFICPKCLDHQIHSCIFIRWLLTRYIPYYTPWALYLVSWQQQAEISVFLSRTIFTIFSNADPYCCKFFTYIYYTTMLFGINQQLKFLYRKAVFEHRFCLLLQSWHLACPVLGLCTIQLVRYVFSCLKTFIWCNFCQLAVLFCFSFGMINSSEGELSCLIQIISSLGFPVPLTPPHLIIVCGWNQEISLYYY